MPLGSFWAFKFYGKQLSERVNTNWKSKRRYQQTNCVKNM